MEKWDKREKRDNTVALAGINTWRRFNDAETCPDCRFYKLVEKELGKVTGLMSYKDKKACHVRKDCFSNYVHRESLNDKQWSKKSVEDIDAKIEILIQALTAMERRFTDDRQ